MMNPIEAQVAKVFSLTAAAVVTVTMSSSAWASPRGVGMEVRAGADQTLDGPGVEARIVSVEADVDEDNLLFAWVKVEVAQKDEVTVHLAMKEGGGVQIETYLESEFVFAVQVADPWAEADVMATSRKSLLRQIPVIAPAVKGAVAAVIGEGAFGLHARSVEQASWCDTACKAAGGAVGVGVGAWAAGSCTGASAGFGAPGCVAGGRMIGAAVGVFAAGGCSELFCG